MDKHLDKAGHFGKDRIFCLKMGGMAAVGYQLYIHRTGNQAGDSFDLGSGPILIIFTLKDKDRAGYFRKIFFNIPVVKFRRKPSVSPAKENRFCIFFVIPGELIL